VLPGKTVINLPGCPVNPYIFLSTVLYFLTFKKLPILDKLGRPKFGYGDILHQQCERRGHFNAGRYVTRYGDQGHQEGWCLYLMGCKGPITHANCNSQKFNDVDVWPVSVGHPCVGCTESNVAFEQPIHHVAKNWAKDAPKVLDEDTLSTYPKVGESKERGTGSLIGAGIAGAVIGTIAGFAGALIAKLPEKDEENEK
jgi:hydrogenase small subunit